MGSYNPSAPIVLGEEWVGIRDEDVTFAPGVSLVEIGHTFTTTASRTLSDARFYISEWPDGNANDQTFMTSVYPAGTEDQSGPVKRVIIPCNNGGITGSSSSLQNATTFAQAVYSPADSKYVRGFIGGSTTPLQVGAYFAVNNFAADLSGKRILGVNLLYGIGSLAYLAPLEDRPTFYVGLVNNAGQSVGYGQGDGNNRLGNLILGQSVSSPVTPQRLSLGSFNPFWDGTLSPYGTPDRMPWTYANLQRLEASATNRYAVYVKGDIEGDTSVQSSVTYLALEVFYCEEKRVAVGGRTFGDFNLAAYQPYVLNTNIMTMRDVTTGAVNPVLPAGEYVMTLSLEDFGYGTPAGYPIINGLREPYAVDGMEGVQVTRPFPYDDRALDRTLTSEQVHVLPQLSLHTSGGPLTEVHVYGRQAKAPVYGTVTATQEILDSAAGGGALWPQVRFYARRFGDTTQDLVLDSPSIPGSSVTLSPADWDDLDEVVDNWKEITLRFDTAPTMGTGTNPQWRFSSSAETAGNQWQVLGMTAPALSGVPGNLLNTVPSAQMLSSATYGAPSAGATINLGWMYPSVSATTDDQTSDAFLLFSQDPPTPAGFAVTAGEQELSTVDPNCPEFTASCIPSVLYYNQLTWTPAVSGATGYEIQRYDTVDGDFSTIMLSSTPTVSGFADYEARVGYPSVYRIRSVNLYDFAGLWSAQVTGTVPSPGVAGADTALLLFTTNSRQDGSSNLAYSAAWENGRPSEEYVWPESGSGVLQDMYNKDFPTAFRPLERGGERFARQILVNAAGVPPAVTARGFESLRNMAWDTVPYICVRNEDGERWYSTVIVPGGSVRRMINVGRLCMAAVQVVETSADPYPVDPS